MLRFTCGEIKIWSKIKKKSQNIMNMIEGNGSEMTFVAGATKINLKNLNTYL